MIMEEENTKNEQTEEQTEEDETLITALDAIRLEHDYLLERNKQLEHSNKLFICTLVLITLINIIGIVIRILIT